MELIKNIAIPKKQIAKQGQKPKELNNIHIYENNDLELLEKEKKKLVILAERFPDLQQNLDFINSEIRRIKESTNLEVNDVKYYFSKILNEKFLWNRRKKIVEFETGAIYSEDEIRDYAGENLKLIHTLKSKFKMRYLGVQRC